MADFKDLTLDITDSLATITFNRPDRLNALSGNLKAELLTAVRQIASPDSDVRCLLLTGSGRGFCAGADLADGAVGPRADPGASLMDTYHPLLQELAALEMPIVSAVNGVAAGAGMSLAISADIVLAAESAYFLQAFINIGLVPDAGSTFILPRLIGTARARAMMMLGEKVSAKTALEWGMIYNVVADDALLETATALAKKLAKGPTKSLSNIRKLMAASSGNSFSEQLYAEAQAQRAAGQTSDSTEGVLAFLEKRPTNFSGQ